MLSDTLRTQLAEWSFLDEESCLRALLPAAFLDEAQQSRILKTAQEWIPAIRRELHKADPIERLIHRIRLDEKEGRALMELAEALTRIPDDATADRLIADKLDQGDWRKFMENYPDLVSKLTWFGLLIGKNITTGGNGWVNRMGSSALREAIRAAMNRLGGHFVLGTTIEQAIAKSQKKKHALERYSFDMLGEAARTRLDADRYFAAYKHAIAAIAASPGSGNAVHGPSISVKLSALHPRFEWQQIERVRRELTPRLIELVETAAEHKVGLTVDAEETDRLEATLAVIDPIFNQPVLKNYDGFGLAVQAYQKRAPLVLDWLFGRAKDHGIRITTRLVKGAYWDKEIKQAQERGLAGFPVYTRKEGTDIAYLACAAKLLSCRSHIMPQFGSHNLHTLLAIRELAGETKDYEIQRLHGMGQPLHARMMELGIASCVYAPVGPHKELLSYLIRRLLENSANSSFIHQLPDERIGPEALVKNPLATWEHAEPKSHPAIQSPQGLFGARLNSKGSDLSVSRTTDALAQAIKARRGSVWEATPLVNGEKYGIAAERRITNPANRYHDVGSCRDSLPKEIPGIMQMLHAQVAAWSVLPVAQRAAPFERLADRLEEERDDILALLAYEAGKTWPDALGELREAVDLCRYYAMQAKKLFGPVTLPGISGEENRLVYRGRGVFVCISPWNFPLAIFIGQVAAALLAGNTAAIKPAQQTPLIAYKTISLLLECGMPPACLALLPGDGMVGAALVQHPLTAGVVFTGSTRVAREINVVLANKSGPIVPLIAETGGINAMIADASALPEQLVDDVIASAFRSAGQRCSAARVLCMQDTLAPEVMDMLAGAMTELEIGHPAEMATDIGPVIDETAFNALLLHEATLNKEAKFIGGARRSEALRGGHFILPQAWEIPGVNWLKQEVFGPILHVVRYDGGKLNELLEEINSLGYGLTGGIHSRINRTIDVVEAKLNVGNLYINRSIIGAVVESQPFGGESLSGTGFKAGGPNYLLRFVQERSISRNLTATGGNSELLGLG